MTHREVIISKNYPEESKKLHDELLSNAEYILKKLGDEETMNAKAHELRKAEEFYKNHPSESSM